MNCDIEITYDNGTREVVSMEFETRKEAVTFCNLEMAAGMGETYTLLEER